MEFFLLWNAVDGIIEQFEDERLCETFGSFVLINDEAEAVVSVALALLLSFFSCVSYILLLLFLVFSASLIEV